VAEPARETELPLVVTWDVDGTLYPAGAMRRALAWDALAQPLAAWRELRPLLRFRRAMERRRRDGGRITAGEADARDRAAEARWYGRAIARAGLRRGVADVVRALAAGGVRQVALSDWRAGYKLAALGLAGAFERVYAGEDLGWLKPAPELWRAVAADLGVPVERVLHVGDRRDTDGAAALAGCRAHVLGAPARVLTLCGLSAPAGALAGASSPGPPPSAP
jgi:HAD superfamily hydrolase (TIGR01509 family)